MIDLRMYLSPKNRLDQLLPEIFERHQTDLIDAGAVRNIDNLGHPLILDIRIALDEHDALGARLEDVFQTLLQTASLRSARC